MTAAPAARRWSSRDAVMTAAIFALVAKLVCAALTRGTNDADAFYNFGSTIWEEGLLAQYGTAREFNHTPLTGWFVAALYGFGSGLGFNLLLRLPGIIADFFMVRLLLDWRAQHGSPPVRALLIFALSPVSFMISGFHGNLDSLLPWLILLAAVECTRGRPVRCAVWFGLACQVKIVPLLVAPVFFFWWLARGSGWRFFAVASALILAGWSYPLVAAPELFFSNVLGYSSNWGSWGVTLWLSKLPVAELKPFGFEGLTQLQMTIMSVLKVFIVAAALGLAWVRRAVSAGGVAGTLALVWAVFFVFAPGVGAQYLVWFAPFLLLHAPGWYAAVTLASSVFLFVFYNALSGGLPWHYAGSTKELVPLWLEWTNLPWLTLCAYLAVSGWRGMFRSKRVAGNGAAG